MGIGVGILLMAVGAILAFATHVTSGVVNIHMVGWILMAAGALGIVLSAMFWSTWWGGGASAARRDQVVPPSNPPASGTSPY